MRAHNWEKDEEAALFLHPAMRFEPVFTWICFRCGKTITEREGSVAEAYWKSTDCDMEMVRGIMSS